MADHLLAQSRLKPQLICPSNLPLQREEESNPGSLRGEFSCKSFQKRISLRKKLA